MGNKFFSLINGDIIHAAPKTKIIKKDELSKLLDAKQIKDLVIKQAEQFRVKTIEECEKLKEQAQKEGFEAGFSQWAEQTAFLEKEIQKVQKELEKKLVPVAVKAAQKIIGRELKLSDDAIVDIVSTTLKTITSHKKVIIYVNKDDLKILEKEKPKLKSLFENLQSLSIRANDEVKPGGCIIESEVGIINAQLEQKWKVLESAFKELFAEQQDKPKEKKSP